MIAKELELRFPTETIQEGRAVVLVPKLVEFRKLPSDYAPSKAPVFFNPAMELNRDLGILAAKAYCGLLKRRVGLCEPLTGTGLRGIRYVLEVEGVRCATIGDINKNAFLLALINVKNNGLSGRISVKNKEANQVLASHSAPHKRFDYIDVDPFGSPVPFLDSALRALRDCGMLALTATDMASLCGVHPRACLRKYGGRPLRVEYCHELAVRLLCGCVANVAAKCGAGIRVVFSHRGEHYVRVYVLVDYGARRADESIENLGFVLHCFSCFHRETVNGFPMVERTKVCNECGSELSVAGPLWVGAIADRHFCELMKAESERTRLRSNRKIQGILSLIGNEAGWAPGYYVIDQLCDALTLPVPSVKRVIEALKFEGFHAVQTHFASTGVRSNAPANVFVKILRSLAFTSC